MSKSTLLAQSGILAIAFVAAVQWALHFPYPSPLIKPLLPSQLRWPEAQIKQWVEAGNYDGGYLEYFARDPERTIPAGNNIVSPADGVIQNISDRKSTRLNSSHSQISY